MKQTLKRFLSIALVCVMLFGMLPVSAFAEDTAPEETPIVLTEPQETVVEETTAPETTVPEETVPETTVPETTVPEETVPEETVAEDPVQDLYDTLMAFETYEALGDYMDAMSEEQYALMDQFSDEQNNALFAKVAELQEGDAVVYAGPDNGSSGDHVFRHLDVRIEGVSLKMTKRVINMVTGAVVDTDETTITANLTKVEYAIINGVTYNNFTKMDAREWRQSNVTINLSALTDSSTAVLVVDLVDANGKAYDNVRLTYNRAGIQYAMEHCDGYKNGKYDGIDFDPSKSGSYITLVEFDDYVIPVMKIWDDANNQDGKRPASVIINLYANNVLNDSATLNEGNNWQYMFTNKPSEDGNGNKITYTIDEASVPTGYSKVVGNNGTYLTVTNSHTPEITSVSGSKTWADNNDQDGIRPESITVNLLANGQDTGKTATANAANGWTWTFSDLDKNAGGQAITYSVSEEEVVGYIPAYDGMNITNTHTPEKTSVSGKKTWNDAENQDGIRPDSITVKLLANGQDTGKTATANAANGWTWTFSDLDKNADGKEITYTVSEETVEGYTATVSGMNVTNTHVPEKIDLSVEKKWDDNNDQDGKRPDSITVNLLANGIVKETVTLTEVTGWTYEFKGLDKYAGGVEIVYTVTEETVDGYETSIDGMLITNKHTPEKIDISGAKTWIDNDDQDGKRPDSITIHLFANGTEVASKTVTAEDEWKWNFTELDKYADGTEITYTITEDAVEEYTSKVEGYNVTNTHEIEKTSVSGSKTWDDNDDQDGKRPDSITINLLADGVEVDSQTVDATDDWAWTFEDLDVYQNGTEIVYTITEDAVAEYETEINGFDVTNTHKIEKTVVSGTKVWVDSNDQDGIRPTSITVHLFANGTEADSVVVTADADGNWTYTFENLDKYADGEEIVYTVTEDEVDGYTTEIAGTTITNTHETADTSVTVEKVWNDDDDRDGLRTESVTVQLFADNENTYKVVTLNEDNDWTDTFTGLDKYRDGGIEIIYTVEEVVVPTGYDADVTGSRENGYIVTNTHEIATVSVEGAKTWDDANDQDGLRPESITINLVADGEIIETIEVTEAEGWAWSFTDIPKYKDHGTEIAYSVTEEAVEGYETTVDGFSVTNTHEIATVSVEGAKTWDDANDQDGKRPESITVNLVADGEIIETIEVTETEGWAWSFTELPKYKDHGVEIVYAITEEAVEGYSTTYDGYNVINSYTPEEISVTVTKAWADSNDAEGIRPDSVTIKLLANGVDTGLTLELNAECKWVGSFTGLPKYADGELIAYTVDEVAVKGYTTVIKGSMEEGFTVTNTHVYIPQTGDDRTPVMWITVMAVSAMMIALVSIDSKKRRNATK